MTIEVMVQYRLANPNNRLARPPPEVSSSQRNTPPKRRGVLVLQLDSFNSATMTFSEGIRAQRIVAAI